MTLTPVDDVNFSWSTIRASVRASWELKNGQLVPQTPSAKSFLESMEPETLAQLKEIEMMVQNDRHSEQRLHAAYRYHQVRKSCPNHLFHDQEDSLEQNSAPNISRDDSSREELSRLRIRPHDDTSVISSTKSQRDSRSDIDPTLIEYDSRSFEEQYLYKGNKTATTSPSKSRSRSSEQPTKLKHHHLPKINEEYIEDHSYSSSSSHPRAVPMASAKRCAKSEHSVRIEPKRIAKAKAKSGKRDPVSNFYIMERKREQDKKRIQRQRKSDPNISRTKNLNQSIRSNRSSMPRPTKPRHQNTSLISNKSFLNESKRYSSREQLANQDRKLRASINTEYRINFDQKTTMEMFCWKVVIKGWDLIERGKSKNGI